MTKVEIESHDHKREALIARSVEDTSDYEDHPEPLRTKKI